MRMLFSKYITIIVDLQFLLQFIAQKLNLIFEQLNLAHKINTKDECRFQ